MAISRLQTLDLRRRPDPMPDFTNNVQDSTTVARRRKILALIPFFIAAPTLVAVAIVWHSSFPWDTIAAFCGVFGAILVFDLAACLYVLIPWLWTGEPPELSLSPLIPTREEREFRRSLRERRKLYDDEFYDAFYADSGIPRGLPVQLRKTLEEELGLDFGGLWPSDNLIRAVEVDWGDIFDLIEREFRISIPRERWKQFDGTFDSLVKLIAAKSNQK
jgi:hypothetical protein